MSPHLRDRILRKLDALTDERGYQVLDYVEFLESRYSERTVAAASMFQRFGDAVEDSLRAGKISATTISKAMGLMGQAMSVLDGVAAAGKSVASDLTGTASRTSPRQPNATAGPGTPAAAPATPSPVTPGEQTP